MLSFHFYLPHLFLMIQRLRFIVTFIFTRIHQHIKRSCFPRTLYAVHIAARYIKHFRCGNALQKIDPSPAVKMMPHMLTGSLRLALFKDIVVLADVFIERFKKKPTCRAISIGNVFISCCRSLPSYKNCSWYSSPFFRR